MLTGDEIMRAAIVSLTQGSLADHVQTNGVDLSLEALWLLRGRGLLGRASNRRRLPNRLPMDFDADGWIYLDPGAYGVRYSEIVTLPPDCAALVFPRSTLLRLGVNIPTAVWDAGYHGRGESILIVMNQDGIALERGTRIAQLVVFRLTAVTTGYSGSYQGENLASPSQTTTTQQVPRPPSQPTHDSPNPA